MQAFVGNLARRKHRRSLSPEFQHAFALEVLKTERLRVIALIVVATVVTVSLGTVALLAPAAMDRIWHGRFPVLFLATSYAVFVLFEGSILLLITRQIRRGGDVPQLRRYLGVIVETSLPSVVIATHMSNMGAAQALAFVGPLLYFIFIILSTLRLDFWLSAFTGLVAGAQLFGLALLHPAAQAAAGDPTLAVPFVLSRSAVIFACGIIAGAVGTQLRRQFEASIAAATARDHVTICLDSTCRRRSWNVCSRRARRPPPIPGASPSCSSTCAALPPPRARARRNRSWTASMPHSPCWSTSSTATAAS
jgi:adenylate cyclase